MLAHSVALSPTRRLRGRAAVTADGRQARLLWRAKLARASPREPLGDRSIAQLRPVRMLQFVPLILVDLPVDVVVVLEQ